MAISTGDNCWLNNGQTDANWTRLCLYTSISLIKIAWFLLSTWSNWWRLLIYFNRSLCAHFFISSSIQHTDWLHSTSFQCASCSSYASFELLPVHCRTSSKATHLTMASLAQTKKMLHSWHIPFRCLQNTRRSSFLHQFGFYSISSRIISTWGNFYCSQLRWYAQATLAICCCCRYFLLYYGLCLSVEDRKRVNENERHYLDEVISYVWRQQQSIC